MESNATLKELHLNSLHVSYPMSSSWPSLLKALANNKTLQHIDLSCNDLTSSCDFKELGMAIQELLDINQCLLVLNLGSCSLPLLVVDHIKIGLLRNTTLTELDLSGFMTGKDSEKFGQIIETILTGNHTLQVLNLAFSNFTDAVMACVAKGLIENCTLKQLYLDCIYIRKHELEMCATVKTKGWLNLFSALQHNSSIHTLSVCKNRFNEEEFFTLQHLVHRNKTITTLKVVDCNFSVAHLSQLEVELSTKGHLIAT